MRESYPAEEVASIHSSMVLNEAMIVTGEITAGEVRMKSPYSPELVSLIYRYKPKLGVWNGKGGYWAFPVDKLDEVKKVYLSVYGEDGFTEAPKVTVEIDFDKAVAAGLRVLREKKALWVLGKQVALASSRSRYGAYKLGDGVSTVAGGFTVTGPESIVDPMPGTIIKITDVPSSRLTQEFLAVGSPAGLDGIKVNGGAVTASPAVSPVGTTPAAAAPAKPQQPAKRGAIGQMLDQMLQNNQGAWDAFDAAVQGVPAGAGALTQAAPVLDKMTDAQLMAYGQLDLILKSIALRASQLPPDVARATLAAAGLKLTN